MIPFKFTGIPYDYEQISPLITKGRLRIFYLGLNRNGGFITKEYAEKKLLPSLPYTPVIGDYSEEKEDFTTHREQNVAQAYGLAPAKMDLDFKWEPHLDSDGVERTYATCNVYLWTGRFEKANQIIGKPHSLELNRNTIKGQWKILPNGKKGYVYEDGEFLGLSVLGEDVEPCFEGSAFYNLIDKYNLFIKDENNKDTNGGKIGMINYRLSHDEIYTALFMALNPDFTEEKGYQYDKEIVDVYDDYVLIYKCKEKKYSKATYTKENDNIVIGDEVEVTFSALTAEEVEALEQLGSQFTINEEALNSLKDEKVELDNKIIEFTDAAAALTSSLEEKDLKIVELENDISTYKLEKDNLNQENTNLTNELYSIKEQKLNEYTEIISEEHFNELKDKINVFSYLDLEKELAFFALKDKQKLVTDSYALSGKEDINTGVIAILEKYKNR